MPEPERGESAAHEATETPEYERMEHKPLRDCCKVVPDESTNEMGQNRQLFDENFLPVPGNECGPH